TTTQLITLTAQDGNGNTAQCTFNVIPADNTNPVITCPSDENVSFDSSCQFILPDYTSLATASDNCSVPTVTQSPVAGTIITTTQVITLTAQDANGNTAQCTFNVIPVDNTNPVIICPSDQNVSFDGSCQYTLPDYTGLATATDNCTITTVTQSPAAGTFISTTQVITLTAQDSNGNSAQCSFNVIPFDVIAPTITCPADVQSCDQVIVFSEPVANDCAGVTVVLTSGLKSGSVFPVGITTNVYTATDPSGNTATCSFNITRYPMPVINMGADAEIDAGFSHQMDVSVDDAVSYEWSPGIGLDDPFIQNPLVSPTATSIYTLTATNSQGCSSSADITITVNENIEINNFMSPNGDGDNDTWEIKGNWLLDDCTIRIFSGYGNLLHESTGYNNDWNGTYKGNELPEGTYYYSISCSGKESRTGAITLLR
ncbi:HYR domain-containing protein, partial [Fulvivirga sp. 29W222]